MSSVSSQQRIWFLIVVFIFIQTACAQRKGGGGTGAPPSRSSIPTSPSTDTSLQPLFIAGRVALEGGGNLSEPVAIERICNGMARREGYTDFKGHFQLQLGTQNPGFQDASENDSRMGTTAPTKLSSRSGVRQGVNLEGCELRAVLAGFQSSTVILHPNLGDSFQIDVGTIVLKRMGNVKGSAISVTSMSAPKDARNAFEKGSRDFERDKLPEAEKELQKAVSIYPQFAAAWSRLGDLEHRENHLPAAKDAYNKALQADPQYVNPVFGLALIALVEKNWQDAAQYTGQVINLNAYAFPAALFYNAAANFNLGKVDMAQEAANKYKSVDPALHHPEVMLLLSQILAQKHDYAGAAQQIREYLNAVPAAANADELRTQAKNYDDLSVAKKQ